jgi:hypothetical protein
MTSGVAGRINLEERRGRAEQEGWTDEQVATDVDVAVKEAREARTARRR